jgi:hypothetical protein
MQRILVPIFTFIWWSRLFEEHPKFGERRSHVVKVKGWRTALVDRAWGSRETHTFMIKVWRWYI